MATFNKFDCFVGDLGLKLHDLNTDTLKVYLSNEQPTAGMTVYNANGGSDDGPEEILAKNGYTAGGVDVENTWAQVAGLGTLAIGADKVLTGTIADDATGFGPFQFAVLYNPTATAKNLIGWWERTGATTVLLDETITLDMTDKLATIQ
jgi:hypothetical protein